MKVKLNECMGGLGDLFQWIQPGDKLKQTVNTQASDLASKYGLNFDFLGGRKKSPGIVNPINRRKKAQKIDKKYLYMGGAGLAAILAIVILKKK